MIPVYFAIEGLLPRSSDGACPASLWFDPFPSRACSFDTRIFSDELPSVRCRPPYRPLKALRSPPSDPKALEEFGLTDDCEVLAVFRTRNGCCRAPKDHFLAHWMASHMRFLPCLWLPTAAE